MSIALLEAMALGIPLVASSIPGNRRIIGDFRHGRLAPRTIPKALARVINEQWANFDRAFHMSRAARGRVEQEFSIRIVARKHLRIVLGPDLRRVAGIGGGRMDHAEGLATDPDARPLGCREADGDAGQGAAARPVPGRGRRADALGPARGRAEGRGHPGDGDRQALEARSDRAGAAGAFPEGGVVRRGPDVDLRGEHVRTGGVAAGEGAGRGRGGDGRGLVEGAERPADRSPAVDVVRPPGG